MPVALEVAESNRVQTERLRRLVARLTPAMLAVRLPRGWTVAVALFLVPISLLVGLGITVVLGPAR